MFKDSPKHNLVVPVCFCSLFFLLVGAGITIWVGAFRYAFELPGIWPLIKAFLYLGAVLCVWQESTASALRQDHPDYFWPTIACVITIVAPCLTFGSVIVNAALTLAFAFALLVGGFKAILRLKDQSFYYLMFLLIAPLLGVVLFYWINGHYTAHVFVPEYAEIGLAHRDALKNSAIAAISAQYGVISSGLDGVTAVKYHFIADLWIGLASRWLNVPAIHGFYLLPQIFCVPLNFFGLSIATLHLCSRKQHDIQGLAVALLPLTLISVFDLQAISLFFWSSPSFLFSNVVFLLGLPILGQLVRDINWNRTFLLATFVGTLLTLSKVSTGSVWFCGLIYLTIRQCKFAASMFISAGIVLWVYFLGTSVVGHDDIAQTHFGVSTYLRIWKGDAILTIIAIGLLSIFGLYRYSSSNKSERLEIELLFVLAYVGIVPSVMLAIPGASEAWFIYVGKIVSIMYISYAIVSSDSLRIFRQPMIVIFVLAASWVAYPEKLQSLSAVNHKIEELAGEGNPSARHLLPISPRFFIWLQKASATVKGTYGAEILEAVGKSVSSDVLIFVPSSNTKFWQLNSDCSAQPFFFPALLAVPMLHGLPPNCSRIHEIGSYGFEYYKDDQSLASAGDEILCVKARQIGFRDVYVLNASGVSGKVHCNY